MTLSSTAASWLEECVTLSWISAVVIVVFLVLSASGASKPLQLDNMDFPAAAEETVHSGVPVYYRGEDEDGRILGLFHPPLYIYTLAAWFLVFGPGEAPSRMFGAVCALLLGLVVLKMLRTLFGTATAKPMEPWFWLLFLLSPYTLQTAAITDIDSTIYGPLLCLALLLTLQMCWRDGTWRADSPSRHEYIALVFVCTLCLWSKLTTVILTFPCIFLLLWAKLGVRRAAAVTLGVTGSSVAIFLATYYAYGMITGLNVNYTFGFTWMSFTQRGVGGGSGVAARLRDFQRNLSLMAPFTAAWTGILPWLAGVAVMAAAFWRGIRERDWRSMHYGAILGLALFTTLFYCAKTTTFGFAPYKYTFVYWPVVLTAPLLLVTGAVPLVSSSSDEQRKKPLGVLPIALLIGIYLSIAGFAMTRMRDLVILQTHEQMSESYTWVVFGEGALALLAIAIVYFSPSTRIVLLAALAVYAGLQGGIGVYQTRVTYATQYDYGQSGFLDTVAFLKQNTRPTDMVVCMKDIGYRVERPYFTTYAALYEDDSAVGRVIDAIQSGRASFAVFTEGRGQDQLAVKPSLQAWIAEHCRLVASFGNYRIYRYGPPG